MLRFMGVLPVNAHRMLNICHEQRTVEQGKEQESLYSKLMVLFYNEHNQDDLSISTPCFTLEQSQKNRAHGEAQRPKSP